VRELEFTVTGTPAPQGSKRAFVRNGRANLVEAAGNTLKVWRADVAAAAAAAMAASDWYTAETPVAVHVLFRLARPKSRPSDVWHATRPDADKLARAVLDALTTARVWHDDSLVADLLVWKHYATPAAPAGAMIAVRTIP
jgi:crossover junction endodeoxyribonuclease RusA